MNWLQLQNKLCTAARRHPPREDVPYAFPQRMMARLPGNPWREQAAAWTRAWWYGAAVCTSVALGMGLWSYAPFQNGADSPDGYSEEVEWSILSSSGDPEGNWW